ncbi:MAG: hypothetical protein IJ137_12085, partial [Eubacterium sp.]|nr:hypothetical protein [Eubacterium sp.]
HDGGSIIQFVPFIIGRWHNTSPQTDPTKATYPINKKPGLCLLFISFHHYITELSLLSTASCSFAMKSV